MRFCIVTREQLPRTLLFRVVRVRPESESNQGSKRRDNPMKNSTNDGRVDVRLDSGNGRSAYVCKDLNHVRSALKKGRLDKSLRCRVPQPVRDSLLSVALQWDATPDDCKGLLFCEVFARDALYLPAEQVQHCLPRGDEDLADYNIEGLQIKEEEEKNC